VSPDGYIQPDLGHALRVWWAYYWPTTLISTFIYLILNAGAKYLYENTALPASSFKLFTQASSYAVTYAIALLIFKYILGKSFRHFRIALRTLDPSSTVEIPATFSRTVRVWWTFLWRTILYTLGGLVVVILPLSWFVGMFNPSPLTAVLFFGAVGFLLGAALSLFVIYSNILDEEFGDFRVCLLPRQEHAPAITPAEQLPQI
jgi:hypothetical protein